MNMDKNSFTYHAERLRPAVVSLAAKLCGNMDDAEDVAQDTFLKMWSMRNSMDSYESPDALAIRIARNKCLDILKKKHPESLGSIAEAVMTTQPPVDTVMLQEEQSQEIDRILSCLPEPQQILIKMRHIEGMDIDTIAEILCTTESNIRTRLCRARQKVKLLFKQNNLK